MDFVGSYYFRIHRIMLTWLGIWPYYTRANYIRCILLSPFLLSYIILQLSTLITNGFNMESFLNTFSFLGLTLLYTIKYFVLFFKRNISKNLMEQLRFNWNSLKEKEELKIMHKHVNTGRRFTFILMILMHTMLFLHTLIYALTFLWPYVPDVIIPLNKSHTNREHLWHLPNMIEYFIDREKYIYLLTVYLLLISFIGATIFLAIESLNMMYIRHINAMFQITSYRIECIVNRSQMKTLVVLKKSDAYENIAKAIDSHQRAIKFLNSMHSINGITYIFVTPIAIGMLSTTLYQFYENIIASTERMVIWFGYIMCHFSTMFLHNYFGQQIIDYSNNIFNKLCSVQWYTTPLYTQKCLLLMMRRSMKCSTMTIGSVFTPSLQGFATLTNTTLSYFMLIYSTRN